MSIIKSLVFAVVFAVQVTNGELYVNCMAAVDAEPNGPSCTQASQDVLAMLDVCTGLDMGFVGGHARRHLRYREQAKQSKRELWYTTLTYCEGTSLNGGDRMMCCMLGDNHYSYCGSPTGNRKLQGSGDYDEAAMAAIAAECTADFKILANENGSCFGSSEEVFCETMQISTA